MEEYAQPGQAQQEGRGKVLGAGAQSKNLKVLAVGTAPVS